MQVVFEDLNIILNKIIDNLPLLFAFLRIFLNRLSQKWNQVELIFEEIIIHKGYEMGLRNLEKSRKCISDMMRVNCNTRMYFLEE